jgi:hypothetical protein
MSGSSTPSIEGTSGGMGITPSLGTIGGLGSGSEASQS